MSQSLAARSQLVELFPLMVDMPVIVRYQDRGALRLDHRHDQALCRRRLGDLVFDHRHNAADRACLRFSVLSLIG